MRIAGMSGIYTAYGSSAGYQITSIHGNPRSMQAVDAVSSQSQAAGSFVIAAENTREEESAIRSKQTLTAAGDYKELTEQMRNGRMMQTQIKSAAEEAAAPYRMLQAIEAYGIA